MLDESLLDAVRAHVVRAFETPVVEDPFPHVVVERVFPDAFYRTLLATQPNPDDWYEAGKQRWNWDIEKGSSSPEATRIWQGVHGVIAPTIVIPALLRVFRPQLTAYWAGFEENAVDLEPHYGCEEGRLLRRHPGYRLAPHLDPRHATITALMYLARPGDDDRYGTDLYRATMPRQYKGIFKAEESGIEHTLTTTVPYRPNTLLAFITPISLHGASFPKTAAPFERLSYQFLVCLDTPTRKAIAERERQRVRRAERAAARDAVVEDASARTLPLRQSSK